MQTQKDNSKTPVITSMEQIQNAIDQINAGASSDELNEILKIAVGNGWVKTETKLVWANRDECSRNFDETRNQWLFKFCNMRDVAILAVQNILKTSVRWETQIDHPLTQYAKPIYWLHFEMTSINWFDFEAIEAARKEFFPAMNPARVSEVPNRSLGIRVSFAYLPDTDPNQPPAF